MPGLTGEWGVGWLWLGGSLLLAVVWANLAWFFRRPRDGAVGGFVAELVDWRFSPGLLQVLRLLYYVGVPFAALLWGQDAVVRRLLGLQSLELPAGPSASAVGQAGVPVAANWLDWARDLGWAAGLGLGTWAFLALGWWAYRRAVAGAGDPGGLSVPEGSGWVFLREAACHEVHWAFYRNAPILAVGGYWGIWLGLGLVGLEAVLNPAWRAGLADPERVPRQLLRLALAVISGVLFLLTENLWLALAVHWGVSWGLATLARALSLPVGQHPGRVGAG